MPIQTAIDSISNSQGSPFGFKNRIINGAMVIDQRNAGASVNITTSVVYSVDRWGTYGSQTGKATIQQNAGSVTPPAGFINYVGVTSSSAYSVTSGDIFQIYQNIEGLNVADLGWGAASASTVTLSFWVRSSLTGTFAGSLYNSGGTRSYPFTYTISTANTWEQKSVTIAGDTTGTWLKTNGNGIGVNFTLGAGSTWNGTANSWNAGNYVSVTGAVSVVGTNGATFYITGVQLEKGSTATSFDYLDYGRSLIQCQRYYTRFNCGTAFGRILPFALGNGTTNLRPPVQLPVRMRAAASSVDYGGALVWYNGAATGVISAVSIDTANDTNVGLNCTTTGATGSQAYMINDSGANTAFIGINAEL